MTDRMMRTTITVAVATGLLAALGACVEETPATPSPTGPSAAGEESNPPGDIPDDHPYTKFTDPAGRFALAVPDGWARTSGGDTTTFSDNIDSVRIRASKAAQPTVSAALSAAEHQAAGTNPGAFTVTTVSRNGHAVLLVTYQADAPADRGSGKRVRDDVQAYTFWMSGTSVQLTLYAPVGADNLDAWQMISDSFTWAQSTT